LSIVLVHVPVYNLKGTTCSVYGKDCSRLKTFATPLRQFIPHLAQA
jgi:hypothetical protein